MTVSSTATFALRGESAAPTISCDVAIADAADWKSMAAPSFDAGPLDADAMSAFTVRAITPGFRRCHRRDGWTGAVLLLEEVSGQVGLSVSSTWFHNPEVPAMYRVRVLDGFGQPPTRSGDWDGPTRSRRSSRSWSARTHRS